MVDNEHNKGLVNWTRAKVARNFKRQSLQNALLITLSGDREKAAIWCLHNCEVGSQTICLQAIPARMSCDDVREWVGEEVLKEYNKFAHNRGLQVGDRSVCQVGNGFDGEAVMDPAGGEGGESWNDDDDEDKPAETAVFAFLAMTMHRGSNQGSWNPFQQALKYREKKEPP